jgi:hypothetical protein
MANENEHQLHITISKVLHTELKRILPDYGAVSSLTRSLLRSFVSSYDKRIDCSPFDQAIDDVVSDNIKKKGAITDAVE